MLAPAARSFGHRLRFTTILLGAALLPVLAQPACGSDDPKRKAPASQAGGEGGQDASAGSSSSADAGSGGSGALPGEAGSGGSAGQPAGGEGGGSTAPQCDPGTADCDDDPTDCEADITTLDQCGACGVMCQQTNGTVICGETGCEVTSCEDTYHDCNETGTDGCEATLDTAENCGLCGHDCGAAACTNGLCTGTTLGSAGAGYRWARTSDALYRIVANTPNYGVGTNYTLVRTPLDGSAEVTMASGVSPGGLTVDDSYVYWAINGTPPAVLRKAHDAAPATQPTPVFEPVSLPVQLRIEGGDMYWTGLDGIIYTRALSAGLAEPGTPIVSAAEVQGAGTFNLHQDFVTTPTAMYWVVLPVTGNQAFIRTAPLAGGTASDVAGAITNSFFKLSVSGEDLYWIRATGAALDGAYHYQAGGTVDAPLVVQSGLNAILQDGEYLYLLGGSNTLYRAPVAGGNAVRLGDSSGLAYAMDFAGTDTDNVYILTSFTHGAGFFSGYPPVAFPK